MRPNDSPDDPHLKWKIGDVLFHEGGQKLVTFDGWRKNPALSGIKDLCWVWEETGVHGGPKRYLTYKSLLRDASPLELLAVIDRKETQHGALRVLRRWKLRADNDLEGTYESLKHRLSKAVERFL